MNRTNKRFEDRVQTRVLHGSGSGKIPRETPAGLPRDRDPNFLKSRGIRGNGSVSCGNPAGA